MRRKTIAYDHVFALAGFAHNINLIDEEWNDPTFQRYVELAGTAIIYDHDLVSFEKELKDQKYQLNQTFNVVSVTALADKSKRKPLNS